MKLRPIPARAVATALIAAAAVTLPALLARPALAQNQEQVQFIYNNAGGQVTTQTNDVNGGATNINTTGGGSESLESDGETVDSGGVAIVRTKVDPIIDLSRTIFNLTTTPWFSFTFTLSPAEPDVYFFGRADGYFPSSDRFTQFEFLDPIGNNRFLSLRFSDDGIGALEGPILPGESVSFFYRINLPAPTTPQGAIFFIDSRPNDAPAGSNFTVFAIPEPGTAALAVGALLPLAGARLARCRRRKYDSGRVAA